MDDNIPNRRSKWDSYDVEEELRTIDKKNVEEDVMRNEVIKERERRETETRILKEARMAAGALKSYAAVAALRAKVGRKCSHRVSTEESTLVPSSDITNMGKDRERKSPITHSSSSEQVQILHSMASASKKLYSGMEKAFTLRNEAKFAMKEDCHANAIQLAKDGLTILDELLDIQKGQTNERRDESKDTNSHCHRGCAMEHHDAEPKSNEYEMKFDEAGQKVDLGSQKQLLVSARFDCQMIISQALLQLDQLASATDFLRTILLEEPDCIGAWIESEQAVRKASATTSVPASTKLMAETEQKLVDEAWETQDATPTREWDYGMQTLRSLTIQSIGESFRRGIVLHREQFFHSARRYFQHTLGLVSEYLSNGDCDDDVKSDLRVVEQGCQLNIAASCILQQLDLDEAIERCNIVLAGKDEENGGVNNQTIIRTLMTRAQAFEDTGSFEQALADLGSTRMAIESWEEVELLARISDQEERIHFVQVHNYMNAPDIQTAIRGPKEEEA